MSAFQDLEARTESEFLEIRDHVIYSYIPDPDHMIFDTELIENLNPVWDETVSMYQPIALCQEYPLIKDEDRNHYYLKVGDCVYGAQEVYFNKNLKVIRFE